MDPPANNCNFWRSNFADVINNSVSRARCEMWYRLLTCRDETIVLFFKSKNHSQGLDHHVKKGKRGACKQKAATVLPDRTAAT